MVLCVFDLDCRKICKSTFAVELVELSVFLEHTVICSSTEPNNIFLAYSYVTSKLHIYAANNMHIFTYFGLHILVNLFLLIFCLQLFARASFYMDTTKGTLSSLAQKVELFVLSPGNVWYCRMKLLFTMMVQIHRQ